MNPRIVLPTVLSLALFFAIAFFGRVSVGQEAPHGILRLAWRTSGEKVQICQPISEAEKAKIPIHMRRDAGCVARILPYRLRLDIDGKTVIDRPILPAGIHGDRPLFVQEDLLLEPSQRKIAVHFAPDISLLAEADGKQAEWGAAAEKAVKLQLEETVQIAAGRVTFVGLGTGGLRVE
jgi:hypothetical protein